MLTKRLHVIYQEIPSFLKAIVGNVVTYGGEESIVDPKSQTVEIRSRNLSFCSQMSIKETCKYLVSASNIHQTLVRRHLEVCGCEAGELVHVHGPGDLQGGCEGDQRDFGKRHIQVYSSRQCRFRLVCDS